MLFFNVVCTLHLPLCGRLVILFLRKLQVLNPLTMANNFLHNWAQKWAKERPRQYVLIWVTFWNFMSLSNAPLAYGWNVWVDDLFAIFYGDQERTMSRGQPVFAFSLIGAGMGIVSAFLQFSRLQERLGYSTTTAYNIGLFLSTIGTFLMGIAVQYKQMWLLYIGCFLFGWWLG